MSIVRRRRAALSGLLMGGLLCAAPSSAWGQHAAPVDPTVGPTLPPTDSAAPSEPEAPAAAVRRFALVIGSNHTLDASQAPLRFADDDAARMAELLVELGVDTELVTHLDRDSQAVFPGLVARAHRPDDAGLQQAYATLLQRMRSAVESGASAELLIYYSGHGDVGPDGQGFLTLDGAKLTRGKLFGDLLARSPAEHNHIIIDACRSEQFVLSRGKDWQPDRASVDLGRSVQEYLDKQHLGGFPNTGVVLAHSADQQTHEWDRYRGGIFTHELVSGLRGGADLNGDGSIEYSEMGAFVSAANHGVSDPRARLEVVVRPPANDERRPLLEHGELESNRLLLFGPGDQHHYTVEDARGVRLADLRPSGERHGYLRLPDGELFVQRRTSPKDRAEAQVTSSERGVLFAHALGYEAAPSGARGSLDQAFRRGLFTTPFGPGYYNGYTAQRGMLALAQPQWQGPTFEAHSGALTRATDTTDTTIAEDADQDDDQDDDDDHDVVRVDEDGITIIKHRDDDDDDDDDGNPLDHFRDGDSWGGLFFGVVTTPFSPTGDVSTAQRRVTANDMRACLAPERAAGCRQVRGFDLRWQLFRVSSSPRSRFPRAMVYFRSGYEAGRRTFGRSGGLMTGDADTLSYVSVPLFVAGNVYLFERFPLRPYAGLGMGLDIIRLDYMRHNASALVDVVARPGFELHAGLEFRMTNYVSLTGEVKQQWSARKKVAGVPDFANEGVTFITGIAIGFPLRSSRGR